MSVKLVEWLRQQMAKCNNNENDAKRHQCLTNTYSEN